MRSASFALIPCFLLLVGPLAAHQPSMRHVIVYHEEGRFAGHPANNGMWAWGNEILVGFRLWHFKDTSKAPVIAHARDPQKGSVWRFARSMDGGETWRVEVPSFLDADERERQATESPGGLDFTHPDVAMQFRGSSFYYSNDRGRTWHGPYQLPDFGQPRLMARTDYIVEGKHELTVFLTAAKADNREGRIICIRTTDGGKTWNLLAFVGPEPAGFSIMPSSVRLSPNRILTTIRRKEGERHWIDAWVTDDNGTSWRWLNRPAPSTGGSVGNSPSLMMLGDGRLLLVYGYRSPPCGIRARLSVDNGLTWGEEIILRSDGGNWDLGYPQTIRRPDGKIVVAYYFNFLYDWDEHGPPPDGVAPGREPYIAATIWDPGEGSGLGFQP
jgi:hypothetical protein